ncbi:guanylate-binding protein 3-like isoform X2 [Hyperolius riggenbachi]
MWCVPHPIKLDQTLVLLDTEGLGDVEKGDNKNDIWLFSLAVLLSSALVYNSKGTIDQDALDKLKLVGEITELIKVKSKDNEDEEGEYSRYFPIFIWAVRDFILKLEIDGKLVSEDEYLENALKLKMPEKSLKNMEYNHPRNCLRMYFGKRKCFVFDLPTADKERLQALEEVSEGEINPNFLSQSQKFCDYVFQNSKVKRVKDAMIVTGPRLGELAKIYTEAITSSNFACMEDAVLSLSEKENKMAVQEAAQYYEDRMKEVVLPTETLDQFLDLSKKIKNDAEKIFLKRSFKDEDRHFLGEFLESIKNMKEVFSSANEEKSRERCKVLIEKYSTNFEKALDEGVYLIPGGHAKYKEDLKAILEAYKTESGKGVKAEEVLQEFLKSKQRIEALIIKEDNALTQREKEKEEEYSAKNLREMEKKLQELEESQKKQNMEMEKAGFQETIKQLMEKMSEERKFMNQKLEEAISEKSREVQLYGQQGLQKHANMYQEQIKDLQQERKKQNDPTWYDPIVNTLKRVASQVVPGIISVWGDVVKQSVNDYWMDYEEDDF